VNKNKNRSPCPNRSSPNHTSVFSALASRVLGYAYQSDQKNLTDDKRTLRSRRNVTQGVYSEIKQTKRERPQSVVGHNLEDGAL